MDHRLARCEAPLARIEELGAALHSAPDTTVRAMLDAARARVESGAQVDSVLPEVFAAVGEAWARCGGAVPVREQFVAGVALHLGFIADVADGEGKDVPLLLAAVLGALEGNGVHVMTAADHLARRRADRVRPGCALLGVDIGVVTSDLSPDDRRTGYGADVTYGAAAEFCYGYLRDNMVWSVDQIVQRPPYHAIVDDADLLLVDDCWRPRVVSGPTAQPDGRVERCARLAALLVPGRHYLMPGGGTIQLTDDGAALAGTELGVDDIYDDATIVTGIRMALRAKDRWQRGRDYDVAGGRIITLDDETGATMSTLLAGGLRQALEAKEGLAITAPATVLATMTVRHQLRQYRRIGGISAAAGLLPEAFEQLYGREVVTVPGHWPTGQIDHVDRLFRTDAQRDDAVLAEVLRQRETGRPVVVGTVTARSTLRILQACADNDIPVRVAVGKDPEQDAATIESAAQIGAVTVLSSGVGRGVETVLDGLAVLGVGRHRSRRHDELLHGLAGRNGTTGECGFFLSMEEIATRDRVEIPEHLTRPDYDVGDGAAFTAAVREGQRQSDLARLRGLVAWCELDQVLQDECDAVYRHRRRILDGADFASEFRHAIDDVVDKLATQHASVLGGSDRSAIGSLLAGVPIPFSRPVRKNLAEAASDQVPDLLHRAADDAYDARRAELDGRFGAGATEDLQRRLMLSCIDKLWREHLIVAQDMRADIVSCSGSLADQVSEFRAECSAAYTAMWTSIWAQSIGFFFRIQVMAAQPDKG